MLEEEVEIVGIDGTSVEGGGKSFMGPVEDADVYEKKNCRLSLSNDENKDSAEDLNTRKKIERDID